MSILFLLHGAFGIGLSHILLELLIQYDKILNFFLGPLEPCIEKLTKWLGWNVDLQPHWKHVFVLMGLYFMAGAGVDLRTRGPLYAFFRFLLGLFIALIATILAGIIPSSNIVTFKDGISNFAIAIIPVLATLTNDILLRAWRSTFGFDEVKRDLKTDEKRLTYFVGGLSGIGRRTAFCFITILVGLAFVKNINSSGLALLAIVILIHALNNLLLGINEISKRRQVGDTTVDAFLRSKAGLIGIAMITALIFALGLLVLFSGGNFMP